MGSVINRSSSKRMFAQKRDTFFNKKKPFCRVHELPWKRDSPNNVPFLSLKFVILLRYLLPSLSCNKTV